MLIAISPSITSIVNLNQESICMLEAKNYSKAALLLTKAVADLKTVLACDSSRGIACDDLCFSFDLPLSKVAEEVDDNDQPFVFETPVRVTTLGADNAILKYREQRSTKDVHQTLKMLSFSLIFNLAITFHLGALHHKSATTTLLKIKKKLMKSLSFYSLATTMLQTNSDVAPLGIMESVAIANNQGHVYRLLHEQRQADECYQKVLSLIIYTAENGQSSEILQFQRFLATAITKLAPTANAA